MSLSDSEVKKLNCLCREFRKDVLTVLHSKQTGHPGGSLSVCEILTVLYFKIMHTDPRCPEDKNRDRLILCKGHAAPMLYRVLAEKGFFPREELNTLRDFETRLEGHPCARKTPGVDMTTGPLGIGLSAALGLALGLKSSRSPARVYAVMGDGEIEEGTVWEACMSAAKFRADNLCGIVDRNKVQLDGTTEEIMPMGDLRAKFSAFGWNVLECDGHSVSQLFDCLKLAETVRNRPTVILADTIKGKGVSFMEGRHEWHGKAIDDIHFDAAMQELEGL